MTCSAIYIFDTCVKKQTPLPAQLLKRVCSHMWLNFLKGKKRRGIVKMEARKPQTRCAGEASNSSDQQLQAHVCTRAPSSGTTGEGHARHTSYVQCGRGYLRCMMCLHLRAAVATPVTVGARCYSS